NGSAEGSAEQVTDNRASRQLACAPATAAVQAAMASLLGQIKQVPPMYSAKKIKGEKLYELARRGERIERSPVDVTVAEFELTTDHIETNGDGSCDVRARVLCSAGTYIRVLAEDFGARLGFPAHLAALRRTRAGTFTIQNATTLEHLQQLVPGRTLAEVIVTPDAALSHLPFVHLSTAQALRVKHGMAVPGEVEAGEGWVEGELVRLRDGDGQLLAIGSYDRSLRLLHPRVVLAT